jgi:hypothetical protein
MNWNLGKQFITLSNLVIELTHEAVFLLDVDLVVGNLVVYYVVPHLQGQTFRNLVCLSNILSLGNIFSQNLILLVYLRQDASNLVYDISEIYYT